MRTSNIYAQTSPQRRWGVISLGLACLFMVGCLQAPESLTLKGVKSKKKRSVPAPAIQETAASTAMLIDQLGGRVVRSQAGEVRYVVMTDLPIGDDTLASLKTLPEVEVLGLSGTRVTNQGMAHLTGLKRLTYLFLNDTAVTDQGLLSLAENGALRYVSLDHTAVSPAAVEAFRRLSPGTLVHHTPVDSSYRGDVPRSQGPTLASLTENQPATSQQPAVNRSQKTSDFNSLDKGGNVVLRYREEPASASQSDSPSRRP